MAHDSKSIVTPPLLAAMAIVAIITAVAVAFFQVRGHVEYNGRTQTGVEADAPPLKDGEVPVAFTTPEAPSLREWASGSFEISCKSGQILATSQTVDGNGVEHLLAICVPDSPSTATAR